MMIDNASDNKCRICLEDMMGGAYSHTPVSLQCGHVFGRSCIVTWSEQSLTCPLCRQEFSDQELAMPESLINRALFNNNRCWICLEDMGGAYSHTPVSLQCGHVFGRSCIVTWSEQSLTCPLCRHEFSEQELAMPESLIRRVLSKRSRAVPIMGLVAFAHYIEKPEEMMTTIAVIFLTAFTVNCLFLALDAALWCLRGRNNSWSHHVQELLEIQLNIFLDIVIGISGGVVLAACVKHIR